MSLTVKRKGGSRHLAAWRMSASGTLHECHKAGIKDDGVTTPGGKGGGGVCKEEGVVEVLCGEAAV